MGYRKNDKEEAKDGKGVGAQDEGFPAGGRADNAADSLSRHGLKTGVWTDGEFMDRGWIPSSFPIKMINYPENFRSPRITEMGQFKDLVDGEGLASKNPMNDCLQALLEDQPRPTIFVAPRK